MDNGKLEELVVTRDTCLQELVNACIKYGIGRGLEECKALIRKEKYGHLG